MAKQIHRDNTVTKLALAALAVLVIGFVLTWLYLKEAKKNSSPMAYAKFGPMVVHIQGHGIVASAYVQASRSDAEWLEENEEAISAILKNALAAVDPQRVGAPDGLQYLQQALKDASNTTLGTAKVQEVLLTDFVLSPE